MTSITLDPNDFQPVIEQVVETALRRADEQRPRDEAGRILWTKQETAEALGVSEATVDRLRAKGLPSVKLGGRVMFRPQAVEAWAEKMEG